MEDLKLKWNWKITSGEEWEGLSKSDHEERRLCQVRRHPCPNGSEDHEGEADFSSWQRRLLPQHPLQPDLKEPRSQVESLTNFGNLHADAFFARYVGNDESAGEIGKVLGSAAAPLEEAKADVMGVWNMLYKVPRKYQCQIIFKMLDIGF